MALRLTQKTSTTRTTLQALTVNDLSASETPKLDLTPRTSAMTLQAFTSPAPLDSERSQIEPSTLGVKTLDTGLLREYTENKLDETAQRLGYADSEALSADLARQQEAQRAAVQAEVDRRAAAAAAEQEARHLAQLHDRYRQVVEALRVEIEAALTNEVGAHMTIRDHGDTLEHRAFLTEATQIANMARAKLHALEAGGWGVAEEQTAWTWARSQGFKLEKTGFGGAGLVPEYTPGLTPTGMGGQTDAGTFRQPAKPKSDMLLWSAVAFFWFGGF